MLLVLNNYAKFLERLSQSKSDLVHFGQAARRYFEMAEAEVEAFEKSCVNNFEYSSVVEAQAHCFAFYMHIRTSLNAARVLNKRLPQDNNLRDYRNRWRAKIKEIIDKTDDMIVHSLEKSDKDKFYESRNH